MLSFRAISEGPTPAASSFCTSPALAIAVFA
jgi:hypothetical protein